MVSFPEDDWEASHFAEVGGGESALPTEASRNDDVILKAMPTAKVNHTPYREQRAEEEVCNWESCYFCCSFSSSGCSV